jgi:hypothetical protein
MLTGPKLQRKVNEKRLELIKPLDDVERRIEQNLRDQYTKAMAINNSITSFLLSASRITETRNRYLQIAGLTDERIGRAIDKVNDAVADLLMPGERASKTQKYIKKLRIIRDAIARLKEE